MDLTWNKVIYLKIKILSGNMWRKSTVYKHNDRFCFKIFIYYIKKSLNYIYTCCNPWKTKCRNSSNNNTYLVLTSTEYKTRHGRECQNLHFKICKFERKVTSGKWFEHHPVPVLKVGLVTILWNFTICTGRTMKTDSKNVI